VSTRGASGIDFAEVRQLKQQLEEQKQQPEKEKEKEKLLQQVLQAREHERNETQEQSEQREGEYFRGAAGHVCGPGGRFIIEEEIGRGLFSSVYRCKDREAPIKYAVKFTRSNPLHRRATEREVRLMGQLITHAGEADPEGSRCLLGLVFFEGFEHEGHLAVVFELMKCDLRTALKKYGNGQGLPLLPQVRNIGKQTFLALRALRAVGVIHCDVKPDNLLLSLDRETVKLSDFGSAMGAAETVKTPYLQPRHYRAPEVILGQPYGTQVDVWGAAATLYELATNIVLFPGTSNNDMIHRILRVIGPMQRSFATYGDSWAQHFSSDGLNFLNAGGDYAVRTENPAVVPMSNFQGPQAPISRSLEKALKTPPKGVPQARHRGLVVHFTDLLSSCLLVDPGRRVAPAAALSHKFFEKGA